MALDLPAQVPALAGSLLSCVSTGAVLVIIILNWSTRHSLRHVLIANLIVSEFINTLNNSISGIYIIAEGDIPHHNTRACVANGFIGQLSVQATDFAVLAMAISTLFIVNQSAVLADSSLRTKILATIGIWFVPLLSSTIIAGLHAFGPVSGNWCWIPDSETALRYGLGHGIRFAIIAATVVIYGIVYLVVRKKLAGSLSSGAGLYDTSTETRVVAAQSPVQEGHGDIEMANLISKSTMVTISVDRAPAGKGIGSKANASSPPAKRMRVQNRQNVARIMLMRAYPFSYVLLWIPGIANRLAELAGRPMQFLVVAQATTQFIGLVDAVLYVIQWRILKRD